VVVFGPHVKYKLDLPRLLAASMLSARTASGYVSLHAALCPDGKCQQRIKRWGDL
jgi:hypothetical protein